MLRPGGSVIVSSPNERWRFPYHRAFRRICPTDREVMAEWGHVRRGYELARASTPSSAAPTSPGPPSSPRSRWCTTTSPFSNLPTGATRGALVRDRRAGHVAGRLAAPRRRDRAPRRPRRGGPGAGDLSAEPVVAHPPLG